MKFKLLGTPKIKKISKFRREILKQTKKIQKEPNPASMSDDSGFEFGKNKLQTMQNISRKFIGWTA